MNPIPQNVGRVYDKLTGKIKVDIEPGKTVLMTDEEFDEHLRKELEARQK